jgi:SAM-dependent methyltransferase
MTRLAMTKHLDLGCGKFPMNPYGAQELYGVDLRNIESDRVDFTYKSVDLVKDNIPFEDGYFDSLSAFDFLEHIPRSISLPTGGVRFPFVDLMSEIHRVLRVGGKLYAITPCYPSLAAFSDPTHVNVVTIKTHEYFCGDKPLAAIYGFRGRFKATKVCRTYSAVGNSAHSTSMAHRFKHVRKMLKGQLSHVFWELEKV